MRKLLSLGRAVTFINQSKATRLFAVSLFIGVGMFAVRTNHASAAAGACSSATDYGSVSFNATNAATNPAADAVNIPAGPLTVWTRMAVPDTTNTTYMLEIDSGTPSVQCLTIGGGTSIPTTPKLTQNPVPPTPATNWTWVNYQNGVTGTPVTVNFATTAKHNIRLVGNKANVAVDRVLFTACTPTGTGDNCTVTANVPPTVSVTAPANSATFTAPATISITANAADSDGTVSKVEFFQGATKLGESLASPYSFSWTNVAAGTYSITAKATDNGGAVTTSAAINVTVNGTTSSTCSTTTPCSIWSNTDVPTNPDQADATAVEVGLKFRSSVAGTINGVRFYKSAANTGTHVASLWSATGTRLANATFTNETASGWQSVNFATPVTITANTTYIVSYHAPVGHYAGDNGYFATNSLVKAPLTALAEGVDGSNGVYSYGAAGTFPISGFNSNNYWVDPLFVTSGTGGTDTTPPVVTLGIANGTIISTDLISTVHANLTSSAYAVSATASDASGIASVVFKVDGVVKATVTTAPFNMTFDARTLTCTAAVNGLGTGHTITATATDKAATPNSATATVTVGATRGADINGDCFVQNLDFSALIAKFGQSGTNLGRADINADDTVQNLDFSALIAKFGQ